MRARSLFLISALSLFAAQTASAAVLWSETDNGGPITHWTKGATIEEVTKSAQAYTGTQQIRVIQLCREPGWFAYVGSAQDLQRGVSCGFQTKAAALMKARQECEIEKGHCTIERVGYDDGSAADPRTPTTSLPVRLPGATNSAAPNDESVGPLEIKGSLLGLIIGE